MICNSWFDYEAKGIHGCSSQPEGGVTGWWQQTMDANGWITHFLKEISTEFVTPVGKRRKSSIVKCRPTGHARCNGINDAESSSLDCFDRPWCQTTGQYSSILVG